MNRDDVSLKCLHFQATHAKGRDVKKLYNHQHSICTTVSQYQVTVSQYQVKMEAGETLV